MKRQLLKMLIKAFLFLYLSVIKLLCLRRQRPLNDGRKTLVLTGTFHSMNWIQSHIIPISRSCNCKHIYLISTSEYADTENVTIMCPPDWLVSTLGNVPARLLYFVYCTVKIKPDYAGGFHLLFNGMFAQFAAKIARTRSLYFCVGGPAEVLGGGINSENKMLGRFEEPDEQLEKTLLLIVKGFDLIVTMGTSAKRYFENKGILSTIEVISGGIDTSKFQAKEKIIKFDFIFVGRLALIKRIDIIIEAIALMKKQGVNASVAIVGDGEQRGELEAQTHDLGIQDSIHFLGKREDIESWFNRSRIFVMTSDSEGLSLALIEAMMTGLPAIVSNVGDLADIVQDSKNGYLVNSRNPEAFAHKMMLLLSNESLYQSFSRQASVSAQQFSIQNTVLKWDKVLA